MKTGTTLLLTTLFCIITSWHNVALANRNVISIVGSSTVFPFAAVVAERFSLITGQPAPLVEATGSGGGIQLFCSGVGLNTPDMVTTSRPITTSEKELCNKNGVTDIVQIKIGYDGIVLANSREVPQFSLTQQQLYLALAKEVPAKRHPQKMLPNFYYKWSDISSKLPDIPILVYGPPPTSGTRDSLLQNLEKGATTFPFLAKMKKNNPCEFKRLTNTLREDRGYLNTGENDNFIVRRVSTNPKAFGIFGFSFLKNNQDLIHAASIDGIIPTAATISNGSYPGARPLYIYVKRTHLGNIPGIRHYLKEFTKERSWGENGYLAEKGMVPLHPQERVKNAAIVQELNNF